MTSTPLHIALVIERFDPFGGGAERSTAQIAEELVRRGHQVTVLTGPTPWTPQDASGEAVTSALSEIEVIAGPYKPGSSLGLWRFGRWARQQLEVGGYDVSLSMTMASPATVIQPRGGTVRETLNQNVMMRRGRFRRLVKRLLIQLTPKYQVQLAVERRTLASPIVRRVVAISGYVEQQLQAHYQFPVERMTRVPNAAEMPSVDPQQRQAWRVAIRREFGIADDATAFLFPAHNPALKGFEPLLEATRLLHKQGLNVVLMLAGGFWYGHQKAVCAMELRDQVRFIRHTRQMAPLYAASDAMVLPTFYDPCSKVVIEALMMGVPAISTGFNGASDFIEPSGESPRGRVVENPWDVQDLASAMAAMTDAQERTAFAEATRGLDQLLGMAGHVDALEQVLRAAATEGATAYPVGDTMMAAETPHLH